MKVIYEEMDETTNSQIEVTVSRNGFYLTTDLELSGQGIKKTGNGEDHKRNKKTYIVTQNAMNKLKQKYDCCVKASL